MLKESLWASGVNRFNFYGNSSADIEWRFLIIRELKKVQMCFQPDDATSQTTNEIIDLLATLIMRSNTVGLIHLKQKIYKIK